MFKSVICPRSSSSARVSAVLLLTVGLSVGAVPDATAGGPPNDSCANAIPLSGPTSVVDPVGGATASPGDLVPSCYTIATKGTVWYTVTVPETLQIELDSSGSSFNSILTVATGSCGQLVEIDCDFNSGINGDRSHGLVDFRAEAGTTYYLQVSNPFEPFGFDELELSLGLGQSSAIDATVVDATNGEPIAGAHVSVRDRTGGFYLLADGYTDGEGELALFPPDPGSYDLQVIALGYQVRSQVVSTQEGDASVTVALAPMGEIRTPAVEPSRIAYSPYQKIITFLPDGSDVREIPLPGFGWSAFPTWSPDGSTIAFEGIESGLSPYEIFLVDADGKNLRQLTNHDQRTENLAWSPDGTRLAFDQSGAIFTIDAQTGGDKRYVGGTFAEDPTWSPDSSMIAYSEGEIRVTTADGEHTMTVAPLLSGDVSWSPDGTRLAVANGNNEVVTIRLDGTGTERLAEPSSNFALAPQWSPDSERVLFLDDWLGSYDIALIDADGAGREVTGQRTSATSHPAWSFSPTGDVPGDAAPTIDLLTPNGGEHWIPGETVEITWVGDDDVALAAQRVEAIPPLGPTRVLATLDGEARSLELTTPDAFILDAKIRIWARDTVGQTVSDTTTYDFDIATPNRPFDYLALTFPTGGEVFSPGEQVVITWEADNFFTLPEAVIDVSFDGGRSFRDNVAPFVPRDERSYLWTVPDRESEEVVLRLQQSTFTESRPFSIRR